MRTADESRRGVGRYEFRANEMAPAVAPTSVRTSDVVEIQQHLQRLEAKIDAISTALLEMAKEMIKRGSL